MTHVVLMAGGRGTRLHGLTQNTPKPMLRVGTKPMIQSLMEQFAAQNFRDFTLCVCYMADVITGYFEDGAKFGWRVDYVREADPLGTAGALRLLNPRSDPFIVMNADVRADIDFNDLLRFHVEQGREATVCAGLYQHQIPFGVLDIEGNLLARSHEKPIRNYPVNAGIYVLPASACRTLPKGASDMPQLLAQYETSVYEIEGQWHDVGHFDSLAAQHINWSLKIAV